MFAESPQVRRQRDYAGRAWDIAELVGLVAVVAGVWVWLGIAAALIVGGAILVVMANAVSR